MPDFRSWQPGLQLGDDGDAGSSVGQRNVNLRNRRDRQSSRVIFMESTPAPIEVDRWLRIAFYIGAGVGGGCGIFLTIGKVLDRLRKKTEPTQEEFDKFEKWVREEVASIRLKVESLERDVRTIHAEYTAAAEGRAAKLGERIQALCEAMERRKR